MIKSELIERVAAANPNVTQHDAEGVLNAIFAEISGELARGEQVALRGFGAFTVKLRPARIGRNPRTGEEVNVEESHTAVFKGGKELREKIAEGHKPAAKPAKAAASAPASKKAAAEPAKAAKPAAKAAAPAKGGKTDAKGKKR